MARKLGATVAFAVGSLIAVWSLSLVIGYGDPLFLAHASVGVAIVALAVRIWRR